MTISSLASLMVKETKTAIYETALTLAASLGLPVTSWQAGDPTRSLYHLEAELLAALEDVVVGYIRSRYLDTGAEEAKASAAGRTWLKITALEDYNVVVPGATAAATSVLLTNGGGGVYDLAAGDLTLKNTATGKTYHNTSGGLLASGPGTTLAIDVEADELGSAGSAAAGEIDALVTTLLGVTCTNAAAAIGIDEPDPDTIVLQCRDKLGSLSPDGPAAAYSYVARNSVLTGTSGITRARVFDASDTGDVTIYLAGPAGGVSGADRTKAETAILKWATPLCITPTVLAASNVAVAVTYTLWIYKSCNKTADEVKAAVLKALQTMIATRAIGGDIVPPATDGKLYKTLIESTIRGTFAQAFRVSVSVPSGDTALTHDQVATLGTVTGTVEIVKDP